MEPGSTAASGALRARRARRRALCRNFAHGSSRQGRRCCFFHGGNLARICRYFQSGFCRYGEHCSYQHIQEEPVPMGTPDGPVPTTRPDRGGPEPGTASTAMAQGTVGAQPTLVCPAPSVTHEAFKFSNMEAEVEEKDKNIAAPGNIPCGASGGEFVPTRAQSASGSQLQGLAVDPDSSNPGQSGETVTRTDPGEGPVELGAVAAPVPIEKLIAQSETVVCGICMERVYGKRQPDERLFGILPNCSHAYCMGCIRKWRRSEGFPNTVIKACPECRITSTYYIPYKYWISDVSEKEKLIRSYKARTGKITCRFFVGKGGNCQFGSDCIYLHELPTGQPQLEVPDEYSSSSSESSSEDLDEALVDEWTEEERESPLGYDFDVLLFDFGYSD